MKELISKITNTKGVGGVVEVVVSSKCEVLSSIPSIPKVGGWAGEESVFFLCFFILHRRIRTYNSIYFSLCTDFE
jgi:hypothetical protein